RLTLFITLSLLFASLGAVGPGRTHAQDAGTPDVVDSDVPTEIVDTPTEVPTEVVDEPTEVPTTEPTVEPTSPPVEIPTAEPTTPPDAAPTEAATEAPTAEPTETAEGSGDASPVAATDTPTPIPAPSLTYKQAAAPVCTPLTTDGTETIAAGGSLDYDCTYA